VIELPVRPGNRVVTGLTTGGEPFVRRAGRVVEIFLMARNARRAREVEVVVDVTVSASPGRDRVPAGQWESHRIVIKLRIQPVIRDVALLTGSRVSEGHVVGGLGLLEVRFMAGNARRGHGLELAVGRVLVAQIAIDCRVSAGQRETIVVLLDLLDRYSPSAHAVALLAIRAQFALVNVSVAVLAAQAHVAEHRLHVALRTRHILVQSAQRVMGLVVIEFRNRANRLPALCGVTVLTGNGQISVRTTRTCGTLVRPARKPTQEKQQRNR